MGGRQAGADNVHTDRDQVEAIRGAAPVGSEVEILPAELDVSGGLPLGRRPSLRLAVEGVESGRYAGIIVAYQSRLFRNVEEEEALWRRVEAAGGEVLLALDGIDTTTVSGRMTRRIKAAINTAEREAHAERFENLRRWATAAGIWQRRQTPTGYRRDPDTRKLVPDDRAEAVREAFSSYLAGSSTVELAALLGMTPSGVRWLLRNRVYLGELRVGRHVNLTAHPAIVDRDTFDAVVRKLSSGTRPPRSTKPPSLLAGIVRCASCGHVMTRGNSKGASVYTCPTHHSGHRCPRPAAIVCSRLDPYVEAAALAELGKLEVAASEGDQAADLNRALAAATRELDAYLDAISPEDVGADAFRRGAVKRSAEVDEARDALARHVAVSPLPGARMAWPKLNAHDRNLLLRSLLAVVIVRPAGRGRAVKVSDRCRVLAYGTPIVLPKSRGAVGGIVPLPFPDRDGVGVLGVVAVEDEG